MKLIEQTTDHMAALKLSHLLQIEALTKEGLTDEERVELFAQAIGADERFGEWVLKGAETGYANFVYYLWGNTADYPKSLFADLPGCDCPVIENLHWYEKVGCKKYPNIPSRTPLNWHPTVAELTEFAKVQQEARR